jgi:ATP-dependent DNA helicase RecQ
VLALLPTGGGKSLCFQLPAVLRDGLTLVVSPLIALMKDQVDQLTASGVAATFLNSTLDAADARERLRGLWQGQYRLLYAAPERLMLPGVLENLREWNVRQIAIDEAHCISEWGHDFRPEYRQLATLRAKLPGVPWMALTATATERVRADILKQLQLRDPGIYVASFNRPNLTYRVIAKARPFDQLLAFLRERPREAGIVYCQSRKTSESVAERLRGEGIPAAPYHAGLEHEERAGNQEKFLRDRVRVVCATIAFGMGINKPNVRFVVHYDLPKNIEGYYQETGRAGRDGLPAECLLLFSAGDVVKQIGFIDEKTDPAERKHAREQLDGMVRYAELPTCRRVALLAYFGENSAVENCGACDNCLSPRETWDGTLAAQKFLSCVWRAREASYSRNASFGIGHLIEVLTGAETDRLRKWKHDQLSTYGIGREHSRPEWQAIGRELLRLGYLRHAEGEFPTVELTEEGVTALRSRAKIALTRPMAVPEGEARDPRRTRSKRTGEIACDEALFEVLRSLRRDLADARNVPAYVVFGDVSLRQMARDYPTTEAEMRTITGVGTRKLDEFGAPFMQAISAYLREHPRQAFLD